MRRPMSRRGFVSRHGPWDRKRWNGRSPRAIQLFWAGIDFRLVRKTAILPTRPVGILGGGLQLPRRSDVRVPVVHQSKVAHISGKAVPFLASLWTDMVEQGRRFDLLASDPVWYDRLRFAPGQPCGSHRSLSGPAGRVQPGVQSAAGSPKRGGAGREQPGGAVPGLAALRSSSLHSTSRSRGCYGGVGQTREVR